jgi:signal transduction histidine kinase
MDRGMRWLALPLMSDVDAITARARLHAWAEALELPPVSRTRLVTLAAELAGRAAAGLHGVLEFDWVGDRPSCVVELADADAEAVLAATRDEVEAPELVISVTSERGRARVRMVVASDAQRAAIERALARVPESTAAALLEAQNQDLAQMLATLREREAELSRALEESRRSANEAAEAAFKLAELGRKKDELLAIASHDIRSPVAAAKGALELLEPSFTNLTDDQRHLLGVARRACDAVVHLVGNLMSSALLDVEDEGDEQPEHPLVDVLPLVREIVELMATEARRKGVHVELEAPTSAPKIRSDLMWARQIVTNLVNNGVKFTPKGGHVWVRLDSRAGRISLVVDDDGVGIPPEKADRVFEKLTKLRPRGTAGERGTGIGLYVTKQLVDRLGGSISLSPRPGGGTRFVVELPVADETRASSPGLHAPAHAGH